MINHHDNEAKELYGKYPDQILIINFYEIFDNLPKLTSKIKNFLNISDNNSLNKYTIAGNLVEDSKGKNYLNFLVDIGYENLTTAQLKKINSYIKRLKNS